MRARPLIATLLLGTVALVGCQTSTISRPSSAASMSAPGVDEDSVLPDAEDCTDPEVFAGWTAYCTDAGFAAPSSTAEESETAAPNPRFGETHTYEDGVAVTVSLPQPYTPSGTASVGEPRPPAFVVFDITVTNGSQANYDPALFSASLQSGSTEAAMVFDSANNIGGTPTTTVLPGRDVVFRIAFGVTDPSDLVMEVAPGYEYEAAIFTS